MAKDSNSKSRQDLLINIAKMYYIEKMSQQEIADKAFLSRSNISHLLKKCVEQNIVEFYVNESSALGIDFKEQLIKKYNLKDIIMVSSESSTNETKRKLGESLYFSLRKKLHSGMSLGMTWGTTIFHVLNAFKPINNVSIDVVQMLGGINTDNKDIDSRRMTYELANTLKGSAYVPLVPYIVNSETVKDILLLEPGVAEHFKRLSNIEIALVGLGAIPKNVNTPAKAGYFTDEDIEILKRSGAVLNLCGLMFDRNGTRCAKEITDRIIGCSYETIANIPEVIAIATGREKADAILAALRTGLVSILAIDENAALSLEGKKA